MREILFRGQRKDNGEWIEGSTIWFDDELCFIMPSYPNASTLTYAQLFALTAKMVDPETVGQYTGLNDKNGNKIFEGDVLKRKLKSFLSFYHPRMKVVFIPGKACFAAVDIDGSNVKFISDYINNKYELEKIGNIHDNPELVGNSDKLEELE